jgi:hypothetical protein
MAVDFTIQVRLASLRIPALLGAEHRAFSPAPCRQTPHLISWQNLRKCSAIFALPFAELHDLVLRHEAFQLRHKAPAHWVHQGCGRQELAAIHSEELHNPALGLQPGHIDVEVHPAIPSTESFT